MKLFFLVLISISCHLFAQNEPERTLNCYSSAVYSVTFSPDGLLAGGSKDGKIRLWDVSNGYIVRTINAHAREVTSVRFSPAGQLLASGSLDNSIKVWNVGDGKLIRILDSQRNPVTSLAFSTDGKFLASGNLDNKINLWRINDGRLIRSLEGHSSSVTSVAFSPDGQLLASSSQDKTIKLWRVSDGRIIRTLEGHNRPVFSIAFSPDGQILASGSSDISIRLWRVNDGSLVRSLIQHTSDVNSVAFSPDGQILASGSSDNTTILWRVSDGCVLRTLEDQNSAVTSIAFSHGGDVLASSTSDKSIKIWNILEFAYLDQLAKQYPEVFAPKGEFETTQAYEKRKQLADTKLTEYIARLKIDLENEKKSKEREIAEKINNSVTEADLKLDDLGTYNADNETFPVKILGKQYTLKVPLSEAPLLKQNWKKARVSCIKRLTQDLSTYEFLNFDIINPVNGKIYQIGERKNKASNSAQHTVKKATLPPQLGMTLSFKDTDGNGFLDGKETGTITASVTNSGKGEAYGIELKLKCQSSETSIVYNTSAGLDKLEPGETKQLSFNVSADKLVTRQQRNFLVSASEANGFDADPVNISFETAPLLMPSFDIADFGINSSRGDNIVRAGELTDFTVRLQNKGAGIARNVKAELTLPANVFLSQESQGSFSFGEIKPGGYEDVSFQIFTNKKVDRSVELNITVSDENTGKTLPLRFEIDKPQQSIQQFIVKGKEQNIEINDVSGLSIDIEKNIPESSVKNPYAVALIISVGNYQNPGVPGVEFARRDASLMRQYLEKTLGFDRRNILPQNPDELMTSGVMKTYVKDKLPAYLKNDGTSEVFIYYVGHGAPSTKSHEAFFVPYDCDPNYVSDVNAYNMKEFYTDISRLKAAKKTVVIDACFSGQAGNGSMLIRNASPLQITVSNPLALDDRSIVFQSSESSQVSNWYPEKQHSMFTYFFLKGLQGMADADKDGQISASELEGYINNDSEGLPYYSNREFQRPQRAVVAGNKEMLIKSK